MSFSSEKCAFGVAVLVRQENWARNTHDSRFTAARARRKHKLRYVVLARFLNFPSTVYILFSPQQVPRLDVASSINPARSSLVQGLRESQGKRNINLQKKILYERMLLRASKHVDSITRWWRNHLGKYLHRVNFFLFIITAQRATKFELRDFSPWGVINLGYSKLVESIWDPLLDLHMLLWEIILLR